MGALMILVGYAMALRFIVRSIKRTQEQHALAGLLGPAEQERAFARAAGSLVAEAQRACQLGIDGRESRGSVQH